MCRASSGDYEVQTSGENNAVPGRIFAPVRTGTIELNCMNLLLSTPRRAARGINVHPCYPGTRALSNTLPSPSDETSAG